MPVPPRWRRRLRAWMRRSSITWWASGAALTLVTSLVVRSSLDRSTAVLDRFGTLVEVPVVVAPVAAGELVAESSVRIELRPASMVPAREDVADPDSAAGGRVALVALVPGEVLLTSRLAPNGLRGAAALLPSGMRALAIPGGPAGRPPAGIGDRVDVLATVASMATETGEEGSEPTVVVAEAALVIDVDDQADTVTVAVSAEEAPAVAYAVTAGVVTLALTGPAPPR